ncbi:MAG: site-2 protease family protein [Acidimicrobiales bacterium]
MRESLCLGTISRIRVGVNWSVAVIVSFITLVLATSVLRATAPGFSTDIYWVVALLTAVLFLASLLGHELSHAIVARRRGVSTEGIVLWALGGVAKLSGDAPDARSELRIAVAGPAASFAFAGAFGLAAFGLGALGASALVVTALWWLAEMNGLLAVFNLLPAYPLDGGRVLRAGLWRHWGDRLRATDASAEIGRFFGTAMIVLGVIALFFIPAFPVNGFWLALVGWFVHGASGQERDGVRVATALDGLHVGDAMQPIVAVAPAYATIENLVERYLRPAHLESCPLMEISGAISGLVGLDQLGRVPSEHWHTTRASDVAWPMTSIVQSTPGEALAPLVGRISSAPSHCAFVFDGGRLVGTVSARDIERVLRSPMAFRPQPHGPFAASSGR